MYRALDVANYIIAYSNNHGRSMSNLKLQKVLYFVQANFLLAKDEPCFREEIQAWDYGPVVPNVYREFKYFGAGGIDTDYSINDFYMISTEDKRLINEMIDMCADYSASTLVDITLLQDAWKDAYEPGRKHIIELDAIKRYFLEN